MDLGERITTARMFGKIDDTEADRAMAAHIKVCDAITCPITGKILDSRSVHLVEVSTHNGLVNSIVHPDAEDDVIDARLGALQSYLGFDRIDMATIWEKIA